MKKIAPFLVIFAIVMTSPIHSEAQVQSSSFNFMLKLLLSRNTPVKQVPEAASAKGFLFLDAREKKEYAVSHIANARWVGAKDFSLPVVANIPKDQPIIVYCSVGKRSEDVTLTMKKAGYSKVFNLYGGIFEWVNQGNPVVNSQQQPTDSVHAYSRFWGKWLDKGVKCYD